MNGRRKRGSRREFFESLARNLALGGLAALTGGLVVKGRIVPAGQECVNRGICRGCGTFAGCGLPQALSAKEASRRR